LVRDEGLDSQWIGGGAVPRAGAGDAPVVFNPQDQDAALAIGEADDRLDEVSVIQSLGFLALELDRIAFADRMS
jgi:hypothetical protein